MNILLRKKVSRSQMSRGSILAQTSRRIASEMGSGGAMSPASRQGQARSLFYMSATVHLHPYICAWRWAARTATSATPSTASPRWTSPSLQAILPVSVKTTTLLLLLLTLLVLLMICCVIISITLIIIISSSSSSSIINMCIINGACRRQRQGGESPPGPGREAFAATGPSSNMM